MPQSNMPRSLFSTLFLLCLLCLPIAGQASTSQSCLESCIPACRNAAGGETGRAVCLGNCVGDCPVYCGTVDTGCALDCLNKSIQDTARSDKSLAAACAQACVIKPNCPPPPKGTIQRLPSSAPGKVSGKAPARAKVSLRIKQQGMDETFVARDRSFSVVVPWDWDLAEDSGLGPDGDYELKATAPGAEFLTYVQFSVRHVTDPGRTAEGFLNVLRDPKPSFPVRQQKVFSTVQLDGREATRVESRSVRTLIGFPDQVPSQERMVVLPLPVGYMLLTADLPAASEGKHGPALERMFQSFRLLAAPQAAVAEVTAEEYAVYGAFLTSRGVTEKGRESRPGALDAQPPHLEDAARARVVSATTRTGPKLDTKTLETFAKICGGLDASLAQDYGQKRAQNILVADRIPVPGISVRSAKKADAGGLGTMERRRPPTGEEMLYGTPISFSRVGFDAGGTTALLHVANLGGNPGTSYLVLMVKQGGAWKLSCALLDNYIIY